MKKTLLFACLIMSGAAYAQSGFFLQPEIGAGISNSHVPVQNSFLIYNQRPIQNVFSYTCRAGFGYQFKKWSFTSGVQFLRSGFKREYDEGDFITVRVRNTQYDYHLLIPLIIGYQFALSDRLFIAPGAGLAASYNLFAKETTDYSPGTSNHTNYTGSNFDNNFSRLNLWAQANVHFGYKISQRMNIIAGPEADYMLTSFRKSNSPDSYQKNYVYTFNAGIKWNFIKAAQKGVSEK